MKSRHQLHPIPLSPGFRYAPHPGVALAALLALGANLVRVHLQLGRFIESSRRIADGWVGFYWGRTIAEYAQGEPGIAAALTRAWLEYFRSKAPEITGTPR